MIIELLTAAQLLTINVEQPKLDIVVPEPPAPIEFEWVKSNNEIRLEKEEQERQLRLERERAAKAERERLDKKRTFEARFSAYYPYPNQLQGGYFTATGWDMRKSLYFEGYRIIAADRSIPFYSICQVTVGGKSFKAIVLDRGGAIKGNKIDIVHPNHEEAYSFGRQTGTLKILRYGKDKWL